MLYAGSTLSENGPESFLGSSPNYSSRLLLFVSLLNYLQGQKKPNGIALAILNAMYLVSNLLMVHKNY